MSILQSYRELYQKDTINQEAPPQRFHKTISKFNNLGSSMKSLLQYEYLNEKQKQA